MYKIKQLTDGDIIKRNGEQVQVISLESNGFMIYRKCGTFEIKREQVDINESIALISRP